MITIAPGLLAMLALMLALQPWATDLYLPSLPALSKSMDISAASAQLTLTSFIVTFAVGQLISGPLSDRYGRRPVLLAGFGMFTAGSILAMVAPGLTWLVAARCLQALGVCCTVVCSRAIVRDLYPPESGPQVFARVLSLLALAPLSAPILGALVFFLGGWRGCFAFLSVVGACGILWMGWRFEESNAVRNPRATHLPTLLRANAQCLRHPQFVAYTLTITGSYSMIFCVLSASPFVFIEHLNMSALAFGIMFGVVTAGFLLGTFVMRRIARFRSTARTAQIGALFSLSGGLLMLGLHQSASPWIVVLPIFIALVGHGILQPTCMMGAAAPFPQHAGTAVALMGFIMHVVAAPVGVAVTAAFDGSAWPMALGIAVCTVLTAVCAWSLVRRLPAEPTANPVLSGASP